MTQITVNGMHCENCRNAVYAAISKVEGVKLVEVDLEKRQARWLDKDPANPASMADVRDAVEGIGFEAD